jgi:decaprenylphospho-beta-D-erythro-pentofuranosid-2-ulose 2-reductase
MARVVIFGATSAIAAEVAAIHAARGDALHLVARDPKKLGALAARFGHCRPLTTRADFDDLSACAGLCDDVLRRSRGVDVALIAHGWLGDQQKSEHDWNEAERIVRTNFMSAVALLIPLGNYFEGAEGGRLGVLTSVAGERGRPRNYTYGASKAALSVYLQGMRSRLHPAGVAVTNLKLGPVDTPMTQEHPKNVFFARPEAVARDIVAAMDARRADVFVPRRWAAIMPIVRNTPEALFQRLRFLSGR